MGITRMNQPMNLIILFTCQNHAIHYKRTEVHHRYLPMAHKVEVFFSAQIPFFPKTVDIPVITLMLVIR